MGKNLDEKYTKGKMGGKEILQVLELNNFTTFGITNRRTRTVVVVLCHILHST
jgi:hypothetical protein